MDILRKSFRLPNFSLNTCTGYLSSALTCLQSKCSSRFSAHLPLLQLQLNMCKAKQCDTLYMTLWKKCIPKK